MNWSPVLPDSLPALGSIELCPVERCDLCGSDDRVTVLRMTHLNAYTESDSPYGVAICNRCGLIYLTETLPPEYLEGPGKHGGRLLYGMESTPEQYQRLFDRQTRKAEAVAQLLTDCGVTIRGRRFLDVLASVGPLVKHFGSLGAIAEGIDPAVEQCRFAKERFGVTIECTTLDHFQPDERYDIVTGIQLINHFASPTRLMGQINRLMNDGGVLFLDVLNFIHAIERKSLRSCVHIDHPAMFSQQSVTQLLTRCGFEIVSLLDDYDPKYQFGTTNHFHIVARKVSDIGELHIDPSQAIDSKLQLLFALSHRHAEMLDHSVQGGVPAHWASSTNRFGILGRLSRRIGKTIGGRVRRSGGRR